MKRRLLAALGIATCVGMLVYVSLPKPYIPPYDANLVRLAASELQGYCAGDTFWKTGGYGNKTTAASCRKAKARQYDAKPNLLKVVRAFCQAIVDNGWDGGDVETCRGIMASNQYWPTYDGGITDQWNRARPYPGTLVDLGTSNSGGDTSRTGGHQGNTRSGDSGMRGYP